MSIVASARDSVVMAALEWYRVYLRSASADYSIKQELEDANSKLSAAVSVMLDNMVICTNTDTTKE